MCHSCVYVYVYIVPPLSTKTSGRHSQASIFLREIWQLYNAPLLSSHISDKTLISLYCAVLKHSVGFHIYLFKYASQYCLLIVLVDLARNRRKTSIRVSPPGWIPRPLPFLNGVVVYTYAFWLYSWNPQILFYIP